MYFSDAVSCYSLFPLLYEAQEYPIKVLLLTLHAIIMWFGFSSISSGADFASSSGPGKKGGDIQKSSSVVVAKEFSLNYVEKSYLLGLLLVEVWGQFLHTTLLGSRLQFLPLMMISIYCSFGMMYSWIWQLNRIIRSC